MSLDPDLELLGAWRAGDKKAAGVLITKYIPRVRRVVSRKVPAHAIDQVVDRVVEGVLKGHSSFREDSTFKTFVMTITRYSIADFHRERQRKPDFDVMESSVRDLGVSPSGVLLNKEHDRILLEALRNIPLGDQILLELYHWEDMTAPELSTVFECPEPTIRSRLRRAMERLKKAAAVFLGDERELADTLTTLDDWLRQVREELRPDYFAEMAKAKAE